MIVCSVIIPCYNYADYLYECLESVISQTYPDWEAIVVDDASSVGNVDAVVSKFNDSRIKVIHHPRNLGLAAARNTGIQHSKGMFILPLDSDDKLSTKYLECLIPVLWDNPNYNCVFPDFYTFGNKEGIVRFELKGTMDLLEGQLIPGPGTLMRKSLWEKVGGYCEDHVLRLGNEDWDFYLSAAKNDFMAGHYSIPLYYYRLHPGSMTSNLHLYEYKTRNFMYRRHQNLFDRFNIGSYFRGEGYLRSFKGFWHIKKYIRALIMLGVSIALFAKTKKGRERIITALKRGINRIFYRTELGRKWFWNNSAIRINDEYGSLNHDFEILREIIRNGNVKHLLDIGCGSGRLFSLYRDMEIKEVVGQDCSNKALKLARRKFPDSQFKFTNTTITGLNFPPSYFDLIISNRVLQHIPPENIDGVVRTLCRLGKFIYANETTLADDKINSFNLFQHDYMNLFSKFGYEIKTSGIVFSETGKKQYWFLYEMTDAKE